MEVTPVPLNADDPGYRMIGSFAYAGGIEITGPDSTILELSDIRIQPGDSLVAVSDEGHLFEARLLFDESGRLSGLTDARVTPLIGERGEVLAKAEADAEGLAVLPNGDRLVGFEGNHRIWLYPAGGGAPRHVPMPDALLTSNEGIEAVAHYPAAGPDAYLVGAEYGDIWVCNLAAACRDTALRAFVPSGFALTALAAYGSSGDLVLLGRAYHPDRGVRASVRLLRITGDFRGSLIDEMTLAAPLIVDNFEGVAVVIGPAGGIRIYLLSDDNGAAAQGTYLLAFDWQR